MTVDFATYCHPKDIDRLHENFNDHLLSHKYDFDNVHVIYQRVFPNRCELVDGVKIHYILEEDYSKILTSNGINPDNKEADDYTHGWNGPHYWKHHNVNHLEALRHSEADYIVLSDADCHIKRQPLNKTWIEMGIELLQKHDHLLIISPGDGTREQQTQNMSQQLFLCERKRLRNIDFDLPFTGFKEGGPMAEYYFMLEGRIGRYMEANGLYRHILGERWRYWHKQWH